MSRFELPLWVRVLLGCYVSSQSEYHPVELDLLVGEYVEGDDGPTTEEVHDAFEYLLREGLVVETDSGEYELTSRGFRTAREYHTTREEIAARDGRSSDRDPLATAGLYVSVGILLIGLFGLFVDVAGRLGVSLVAYLFLAGAGFVVVLTLIFAVLAELAPDGEITSRLRGVVPTAVDETNDRRTTRTRERAEERPPAGALRTVSPTPCEKDRIENEQGDAHEEQDSKLDEFERESGDG